MKIALYSNTLALSCSVHWKTKKKWRMEYASVIKISEVEVYPRR